MRVRAKCFGCVCCGRHILFLYCVPVRICVFRCCFSNPKAATRGEAAFTNSIPPQTPPLGGASVGKPRLQIRPLALAGASIVMPKPIRQKEKIKWILPAEAKKAIKSIETFQRIGNPVQTGRLFESRGPQPRGGGGPHSVPRRLRPLNTGKESSKANEATVPLIKRLTKLHDSSAVKGACLPMLCQNGRLR